jgi:amino acid adenylation domain-containing protein
MTPAVPVPWTVGGEQPYPASSLTALVWAAAARRPSAVAVRQWARELTYAELTAGAAALAARLGEHGIGVEDRVAVSVTRQPSMVTAVLGVLAAGAAYVPVDPAHPAGRRDVIVAEARITVAVVDAAGRAALSGTGLTLIDVPEAAPETAVPPQPPAVHPDNAAYVLYTSGSTGTPKGVVVSHRSVVAFCTATGRTCGVGDATRGIAFASLTFDVSVLDLFTVLLRGGTVCLVPEEDRADAERLQKFLVHHRVTWGYLAPAVLPLLDPRGLTDLACLIVGGEPTSPEQVARWSAGGRAFLNWYGPTEATVSVTGSRLGGDWTVPLPIGRPLPNHRCYVLDGDLRPVPAGVPGELYVAGVGLARGYLGAPGLTAWRFRPDPRVPGGRMYATGDRVRWGADGTLEFLGRLDGQVKVNGHRVELGEVEAVIGAHPKVAQAAVDVRRRPSGEAHLVAYVTGADAPTAEDLRAHLARRLPSYMVPARIVHLDALPLNASSKVDLAALAPLLDPAGGEAGTHAWATATQQAVADAWRDLLDVATAGPGDDFVASGGTSLVAMRLAGVLRERLGRQVSVADVFDAGTLGRLADTVGAAAPVVDATPRAGSPARLSGPQRRLWFIDRLVPSSAAYHIAVAQRLRGPLDVAALAAALAAVARRHAALRWRIPERDGVAVVEVDPPGPVRLTAEDTTEEALPAALRQEACERFDLGRGPLWRARLFRLGPDDQVLAITVHHIVFDGWSLGVFYRDLSRAYASGGGQWPGAEGRLDFADYVAWVEEHAVAGAGPDRDWWRAQLAGVPTVLDLPGDRPRPPVATFHGESVESVLPAVTTAEVRRLGRSLRVTGYAVLLAAFGQLLRRLSGATDLLVGAPVADRRHPAFDETIGFMVDTLPLRLRVDDEAGFDAHVRACHRTVVAAMAHRGTPFDSIVNDLRAPRDLSRNPVIQVLFNMYSLVEVAPRLAGVSAEELTPGLPGSLFDLTLYAIERDGGITLQAVYNPDLFDRARMVALLDSYTTLLDALLAAPQAPVHAAVARPATSTLPSLATPLPPPPPVVPLVETIARTVVADPERIAVTGVEPMSYRRLWALATTVAARLCRQGTPEGQVVGVLAARDVTLPGVLLGVLWSGARWLLLDPAMPAARLAELARRAGVRRLLACPGTAPVPGLPDVPVIEVAGLPAVGEPPTWRPTASGGYLMATSGTTGEPLLVEADEAPLARFLGWYADRYRLTDRDSTALLGGLGHDPLLRDAFAPLVSGGRVCVPEADRLRDPVRLAAFLAAQRVTVLHLTPALGRLLATAGTVLPHVRLIVLGGEAPDAAVVADLRRLAPTATLVNGYGATETPQLQAAEVIGEAGAATPVGAGVNGAELHVRTPGGAPAAIGELGEVVIRGRNLARGYTDPAHTARRFRDNEATGDPADRLFATGDLGRFDAAGRVVLAGRRDGQVKIRGFRVELGEVEAALATQPDVAAVAATTRTAGGDTQLYAYAVPRRGGVSPAALRAYLADRLPEYARPTEVVLVPEIPLTGNGKVDRAALPAPGARRADPDHTAAATPLERQVAAVWCEVLGLPRVSVTANFFDIGGHSLAIVTVQARLREALGVSVDLVDLFRFPHIRGIAAHLAGQQRAPGLDRAERRLAVQRRRGPTHRPDRGSTRASRSAPHDHPDT